MISSTVSFISKVQIHRMFKGFSFSLFYSLNLNSKYIYIMSPYNIELEYNVIILKCLIGHCIFYVWHTKKCDFHIFKQQKETELSSLLNSEYFWHKSLAGLLGQCFRFFFSSEYLWLKYFTKFFLVRKFKKDYNSFKEFGKKQFQYHLV